MSINTYYNNATYFPFLLYYICALEISNLDSLIFMSPPHISIASVSDQLKHESFLQSFLQLCIYWGQWVENHQFSILPIHIGSPYPLYQINIKNRSVVILKLLNLYSAQISVIMNRHSNKNLVLVFCVLYLTNASAVGGLHESFLSLP